VSYFFIFKRDQSVRLSPPRFPRILWMTADGFQEKKTCWRRLVFVFDSLAKWKRKKNKLILNQIKVNSPPTKRDVTSGHWRRRKVWPFRLTLAPVHRLLFNGPGIAHSACPKNVPGIIRATRGFLYDLPERRRLLTRVLPFPSDFYTSLLFLCFHTTWKRKKKNMPRVLSQWPVDT
jgi:hypothetical protein